MIEIVSLEFENIGLFVEKQTISFLEKNNLIQVIAERSDYNGSSGSGKSTIFNAIDYALGVNDIPASSLQSRKTKDGISVTLDLLWDGNPVKIIRSKKQGLSVSGVDPYSKEEFSVSGSVEQAEEKIDEIIGLPREIFKKMIHKTQKEGGFFLNLTPSESYKFLVKALKLEEWLKKENKINDLISKMQIDLEKNNHGLSLLKEKEEYRKNTVFSIEQQLNGLVEPLNLEKIEFSHLSEQKKQLEKDRESEELVIQNKKPSSPRLAHPNNLEAEGKIKDLRNNESQQIKELLDKEYEIKQNIFQKQNYHKNIKLAQTQKEESIKKILLLKKDIESIKKHECPTCSQKWHTDASEKHLDFLKKEAIALAKKSNEIDQDIESIKREIEKIPLLEKELLKVSSLITTIKDDYKQKYSLLEKEIVTNNNNANNENFQKNKQFQEDMERWAEALNSIRNFYLNKIQSVESEIRDIVSKNQENESILSVYRNQKNNLTKDLANAKMMHEASILETEAMEKLLNDSKYNLDVAQNAKYAIKSFLNNSFQEALDQIGAEATMILSKVPNASTSTIRLEAFKEIKGKIKEEVNALISINGDEDVNIKTLSGGERSSIDGAVDLSVCKIVEERSGMGANWIVLDEPFEGLDTQSRLDYIEILKEFNTNKKLLIVDHTNEVKELAEDVIKVVRENDKSYIQ